MDLVFLLDNISLLEFQTVMSMLTAVHCSVHDLICCSNNLKSSLFMLLPSVLNIVVKFVVI